MGGKNVQLKFYFWIGLIPWEKLEPFSPHTPP